MKGGDVINNDKNQRQGDNQLWKLHTTLINMSPKNKVLTLKQSSPNSHSG